jgi:hypothetical protein
MKSVEEAASVGGLSGGLAGVADRTNAATGIGRRQYNNTQDV